MIEAFGAGTAAIVAPIKCIGYRGQDYAIPLDADNPQAGAGKLTKRLANEIMAIQVRSLLAYHIVAPSLLLARSVSSEFKLTPPPCSTVTLSTSGLSSSISKAYPSLSLHNESPKRADTGIQFHGFLF